MPKLIQLRIKPNEFSDTWGIGKTSDDFDGIIDEIVDLKLIDESTFVCIFPDEVNLT